MHIKSRGVVEMVAVTLIIKLHMYCVPNTERKDIYYLI